MCSDDDSSPGRFLPDYTCTDLSSLCESETNKLEWSNRCPETCGLCSGAVFVSNAALKTELVAWTANQAESESRAGPIATWDTSKVTDMQYMFLYAAAFNGDISAWDTSQVTDMQYMFLYA